MTSPRYPVTAALAQALARLQPSDMGPIAVARAEIALLDTIAVMAAGMGEAPVCHLRRVLVGDTSTPTAARDRALILGTAAHALDYDDVAFGGHVSAVIVPAILALLPDLPRIEGPWVLLAYAAGVEAWSEVATREQTLYHAKGGHPTGLLGPIGAAAAAAVLLRLDPAQTRHALAIAASLGSGLTVNFGTMTKPFHAGRAAEAGVVAALLAKDGMTAAPDSIEAANGFLQVHSPAGELDLDRPIHLETSGLRLETVSPSVKRFPVCYAAHRATDAALALHSARVPNPEDIAGVEIITSLRHAATLRYRDPRTVAEARFSLEFAVACGLVLGRLGLAELTDARLKDPALLAVISLCRRRLSDEHDPTLDGYARFDAVLLYMKDGSVHPSPEIVRPLGHADRPLGTADLDAKLHDCLAMRPALPSVATLRSVVSQLNSRADGSINDLCLAIQGLWEPLATTAAPKEFKAVSAP